MQTSVQVVLGVWRSFKSPQFLSLVVGSVCICIFSTWSSPGWIVEFVSLINFIYKALFIQAISKGCTGKTTEHANKTKTKTKNE